MPRPLAFLLLATGLALGLALGVASAAQAVSPEAAAICEPDVECKRACQLKTRWIRRTCIEAGHPRKECAKRASEFRRACFAGECGPRPDCRERCEQHGKKLLHRCIEYGGEIARCKAEAKMAIESCIEENCRGCDCPEIYDPVCGEDGMTYPNACEARCAKVEVRHPGICEPGCPPLPCDVSCEYGNVIGPDGCPTCQCKPPPGCDSNDDCKDGQVCWEICSLRPCRIDEPDCAPCFGVCVPRPDPCICTDEYDPVCGTDGTTYGNACEARCAGVPVAYEGECGCFCPQVYDPVCGADGVTYPNACEAGCRGVDVRDDGPCLGCGLNGFCPVLPLPPAPPRPGGLPPGDATVEVAPPVG